MFMHKIIEYFQCHFGMKLIKFLLAGLPSFVIAIPLNWFLVEKVAVAKPISYAIVLLFQVTINFFICRIWVFKGRNDVSLIMQFISFMGGILLFRILDWSLYSFLTSVCGLYYLAVQLSNIVIFAFLKFGFSKRIMEERDNV